ncbi:MAG: phage tail assembly protein [Planctomycetota bacterium]|jgi:hypothetical protein
MADEDAELHDPEDEPTVDDAEEIETWPHRFPLRKPIEDFDGEMLDELVLREPTLGRMKAQDGAKGDVDRVVRVLMRLTGLRRKTIEQLGPADYPRLAVLLGGFIEAAGGDEEEGSND